MVKEGYVKEEIVLRWIEGSGVIRTDGINKTLPKDKTMDDIYYMIVYITANE